MPNTLRSICFTLSLTVLSAAHAAAQSEVAVLPGEPLRLEIVGPAGAPVGTRCSGRVTSAAQDTLIVASAGSCKQGNYMASLQVIRGDHGARWDHVALSGFAGGAVGALVGRMGAKNPNTGEISRGRLWGGFVIGGLVGGAVGYSLPSGPRWVRAGSPRPLRVSGVQLRPGVQVSLETRTHAGK
jgi:hypothetical protein